MYDFFVICQTVLVILFMVRYNRVERDDKMFKRRKKIIRVVSIILCIMMVLGIFSILMYSIGGLQ